MLKCKPSLYRYYFEISALSKNAICIIFTYNSKYWMTIMKMKLLSNWLYIPSLLAIESIIVYLNKSLDKTPKNDLKIFQIKINSKSSISSDTLDSFLVFRYHHIGFWWKMAKLWFSTSLKDFSNFRTQCITLLTITNIHNRGSLEGVEFFWFYCKPIRYFLKGNIWRPPKLLS